MTQQEAAFDAWSNTPFAPDWSLLEATQASLREHQAALKVALSALSRIEKHRTTDMYWASGVARDAIVHVKAMAVMPDNAAIKALGDNA